MSVFPLDSTLEQKLSGREQPLTVSLSPPGGDGSRAETTSCDCEELFCFVSWLSLFSFYLFYFIFFLSKTLVCMHGFPIILGWIMQLARSRVVLFSCFEVVPFVLCLRAKQRRARTREKKESRWVFSSSPRRAKISLFNVWTPAARKKNLSVAGAAAARTARLFIPGRAIRLHLLLRVQICLCRLCERWGAHCCAAHWLATTQRGGNSCRHERVSKVTNAITKGKV